jgi:hypothetical protein
VIGQSCRSLGYYYSSRQSLAVPFDALFLAHRCAPRGGALECSLNALADVDRGPSPAAAAAGLPLHHYSQIRADKVHIGAWLIRQRLDPPLFECDGFAGHDVLHDNQDKTTLNVYQLRARLVKWFTYRILNVPLSHLKVS